MSAVKQRGFPVHSNQCNSQKAKIWSFFGIDVANRQTQRICLYMHVHSFPVLLLKSMLASPPMLMIKCNDLIHNHLLTGIRTCDCSHVHGRTRTQTRTRTANSPTQYIQRLERNESDAIGKSARGVVCGWGFPPSRCVSVWGWPAARARPSNTASSRRTTFQAARRRYGWYGGDGGDENFSMSIGAFVWLCWLLVYLNVCGQFSLVCCWLEWRVLVPTDSNYRLRELLLKSPECRFLESLVLGGMTSIRDGNLTCLGPRREGLVGRASPWLLKLPDFNP